MLHAQLPLTVKPISLVAACFAMAAYSATPDVLVFDQDGRASTGRFRVLDHEEGALGAMRRADSKFIAAAATVNVSLDAKWLKVEFDCPVPEGVALEKVSRSAWVGDCVELFVRPSLEEADYFQYAANAAGVFAAYKFSSPGAKVLSWKTSASAEAKETARGFRVSFAVPVREMFKSAPVPGDAFGINFTRSGRTSGGLSTWAAVGSNFHDISAFGRAVVGGPDRYFARRLAAMETSLPSGLSDFAKAKVVAAFKSVRDVLEKRGADADAFGEIETMIGNLDKTLLEIAFGGRPLMLHVPSDIWGNKFEPDASTVPMEKIRIKAVRHARTICAFAMSNLRNCRFTGQIKFFDGKVPDTFNRSKCSENGIARRFSISRGFPINTTFGRNLYDPVEPLAMGSLIRLGANETAPVFVEFDAGDADAGIHTALMAVKSATPGYGDVGIPVEVEIADAGLQHVDTDKAGYDYVQSAFRAGRHPTPNLAALLVRRGYNVLYFCNIDWFPVAGKDGSWEGLDYSPMDRRIEAALAAGLPKERAKIWIHLGMQHDWNTPRDSKRQRIPYGTEKWNDALRYMVEGTAAYLEKHYGIGRDRIWWYPVDEPSGSIEDTSFKSQLARAYHAARVIKAANPRNVTMFNPLPKFLGSNAAKAAMPRLAEVFDIIELYRYGVTDEIRRLVKSMPFKEIWTYSIERKETHPVKYRRDYWDNVRDGFREITTFWHMDAAAGGDAFDSTDSNRPGRYDDYATLYVDFDNDSALLSRRQLAADMGAEDARLVLALRRRFKDDPKTLADINALVAVASAGTMAKMDEVRGRLISLLDRRHVFSVVDTPAGPRLAVNGVAQDAVAAMPSPYVPPKESVKAMRVFSDAGVRLFSNVWSMRCRPHDWWIGEGRYRWEAFDALAFGLLESCPAGWIMPRIKIEPPEWWIAAHAGEMSSSGVEVRADSRLWRDLYRRMLRDVLAHVAKSSYADRVAGYHIGGLSCGEWLDWKRPHSEMPLVPDRFAADPFAEATAPRREYLRKRAKAVSDSLLDAAALVKELTRGEKVVCAFFGYGQSIDHEDVMRVVDSGLVDIFSSPAYYRPDERGVGAPGVQQAYGCRSSFALHGRVFYEEADPRTHLAAIPDMAQSSMSIALRAGKPVDLAQSIGVIRRIIGKNLAQGTGLWWFLIAGNDTFADPAMMESVKRGMDEDRRRMRERRPQMTDVAVFTRSDEYATSSGCHTNVLYKRKFQLHAHVLPRIGIAYDAYDLSDITHPKLPDYGIYLLSNAFTLSDDERKAIERLGRLGKKIFFLDEPVSEKELRDRLAKAGAHVWLDTGDVVFAGHGYLTIHASSAGVKHVRLPYPCNVKEIFHDGSERKRVMEFTEKMEFGETRVYSLDPVK